MAVDWYSQTMDYTYWDLSAANLIMPWRPAFPRPMRWAFGGAFVMNKTPPLMSPFLTRYIPRDLRQFK